MKICKKCGEEKSLALFYVDRSRVNVQPRHICKECDNKENALYRKSIEGIITQAYSHQKECSKTRGHIPPTYTRNELRDWILAQPNFMPLYTAWVDSGYVKNLKPSIDRLNDAVGYTFDNIQLVAFGENTRKQYDKILSGEKVNFHRKVNQYTLEGKFIQTFNSAREAKRVLDKKGIAITGCCLGTHPTAGGFYWRYFEGNTSDIFIEPFIKAEYIKKEKTRAIAQYSLSGDFIKSYSSMVEAHRETAIYLRSIRECCQGKVAQAKGFIWKYADETL